MPIVGSRQPTPIELLAELKSTAWTCASINASSLRVVAAQLLVLTGNGASAAALRHAQARTEDVAAIAIGQTRGGVATVVEEVVDHPILTLFRQVNPAQNAFDLWELTELYLEVDGSAYWLLDFDPLLNIPSAIWILPAQLVMPRAHAGQSEPGRLSTNIAA